MKACTSKGASTGCSRGGVLISWKTIGNEVCSAFKDLYHKREREGDVTIVCSGQFIKAHKFVLSVGSSYFRDAFESAPSKHPTILLKGISATTMNSLLCYLYFGEVIIHPAFVKDLNSAAKELGMFSKDTMRTELLEIPEETQVFKKPWPKRHPKIVKQVNAPADQFPVVKIKDTHAFKEQTVSAKGSSLYFNSVGLKSGGKCTLGFGKKAD